MNSFKIEPEVGMGATVIMWSDRHAYTIVSVSLDKKKISIQKDTVISIGNNGPGFSQEYEYFPNLNGNIIFASLRKDGSYVVVGESLKNGTRIGIGYRREFYDYSF
ncbi:MAG TPA: hypothetical protein VII94_06215 [Candidatus Saccharimonadales bacterium]